MHSNFAPPPQVLALKFLPPLIPRSNYLQNVFLNDTLSACCVVKMDGFHWLDYVLFVAKMVALLAIGQGGGMEKQKTTREFLIPDLELKWGYNCYLTYTLINIGLHKDIWHVPS